MADLVTVASHDTRNLVPNGFLLAVHTVVGNILLATGRGGLILKKTMQHLGANGGHAIAEDGAPMWNDYSL